MFMEFVLLVGLYSIQCGS